MRLSTFMMLLPAVLLLVGKPACAQETAAESLAAVMKTGMKVFEERCTVCHSPDSSIHAVHTAAEWRVIIRGMLKEQEALPAGPEESVAVFLEGAGTFNRKCLACHSRDRCFSQKRSLHSWMSVVRKMRLRSESGLSSAEADAISAYLAVSCPED